MTFPRKMVIENSLSCHRISKCCPSPVHSPNCCLVRCQVFGLRPWKEQPSITIAICTDNWGFEMSMWFKADQPFLMCFIKLTAKGQEEMDTQLLIFPYLIWEILFTHFERNVWKAMRISALPGLISDGICLYFLGYRTAIYKF